MREKLSLSELQLLIKDSLYLSLPGMYWIVAEISEIKENYAGHCFIELIEKNNDEVNVRARVRAVIWAKKYQFLRPLFEQVTGESLKVGFKVLLRITVEYHEIYGLSLIVNDIDPSFTIGEMSVKRSQILKRLEEEGVTSMNREILFPVLPKNIAIISSKNAAGYTDFLNHLNQNSFGYNFNTVLFDASMQGTETEASILDAFDRIANKLGLFDIVVIIRGGGAQMDLSWFDNYKIAYHITQFPLPVLTGIGHEKDVTVTDLVANKYLKTPTAVADYIIDTFSETEKSLMGISDSIAELAAKVIGENRNRLDRSSMKLIPIAGLKIAEEKNKVSVSIISLINTGKRSLIKEGIKPANFKSQLASSVRAYIAEKGKIIGRSLAELNTSSVYQLTLSSKNLDTLYGRLMILSPANVLRRGYSLTSKDGRIVKSVENLKEGDIIDTRFSDGSVKSKISKRL